MDGPYVQKTNCPHGRLGCMCRVLNPGRSWRDACERQHGFGEGISNELLQRKQAYSDQTKVGHGWRGKGLDY